jgi:hypothetical protein
MTWKIESFTDIGGNKDQEFLKVLDLPKRTSIPMELAVSGPMEFLRTNGWKCVDAYEVSSNIDRYRDFLSRSLGEFSVAKHTYVATRSGWFSDRTECYLASGRPAVVQDTGFSEHLPCGKGLIAYETVEQAVAGLEEVAGNYEAHSRTARDIAEAHFASDVVLRPLLERCMQAPNRAS